MDLNLLKLKDLRLLIVHTQFRIWRPRLLLEFMWLTKTRYYVQSVKLIYPSFYNWKVKSSSEMEPFAAKTLLLNLAHEHRLQITSVTTDRSSSVKTAIRFSLILVDLVIMTTINLPCPCINTFRLKITTWNCHHTYITVSLRNIDKRKMKKCWSRKV